MSCGPSGVKPQDISNPGDTPEVFQLSQEESSHVLAWVAESVFELKHYDEQVFRKSALKLLHIEVDSYTVVGDHFRAERTSGPDQYLYQHYLSGLFEIIIEISWPKIVPSNGELRIRIFHKGYVEVRHLAFRIEKEGFLLPKEFLVFKN